jgi:tetratricopeptide (TPR) repeat protein
MQAESAMHCSTVRDCHHGLLDLVVVLVLLPAPAAAQQATFVSGLGEFARAMVASPQDVTAVNAALDKMAAGLARWDNPPAPLPAALVGDEAAEIPILPLAAYADGFGRILRGDYRDAISSLRRGAAITSDERSDLIAAGTLAQQGRTLEAERALRAIVTAFPGSGVARWWLARVYESNNRTADARREYEMVLPVALTGRATLHAAIGWLARREGDFAGTRAAFERRVALTSSDPAAHKELAWILLEQDRRDEALAAYEAARRIAPDDGETHAAIGRIHLDDGRPGDAVTALGRALELRPDRHEARYALANALMQLGRRVEARRELELFERFERDALERRRRGIANDVEREEKLWRRQ